MAETALVTGGTGFIGGWCIVELLKRGYDVRTTVRNSAKADAVRAAVARGGASTERLTFAAADLNSDEGWDGAVAGCDYVLHVASPLGSGAERDPDSLVGPAREGALRLLRAAVKAGVKRVVLTSSAAAATPTQLGVNTVSDETTWADADRQDPYRRSKTLAERAAWDFMEEHGGATTMTTVLPCAVFGPVLSKDSLGSVQFIQRLVDGRLPRVPRVGLNVVDVRDVADLHIRAMTSPEAAGQRFLANGEFMWMMDVASTLRAKLGQRAPKIPTKALPDFVVNIGANFSGPLRVLKSLLNRSHRFSADKAKRMLGYSPRPAAETVVDCAESLIA
jgi:nucleoside-diphosphate-sugar epimerase